MSVKVLSKICTMVYSIERYHKYCYVTLENSPHLPGQVLDEIETFSFIDPQMSQSWQSSKLNDNFYIHHLVPRIYNRINRIWNLEYGIPVIKFTGHTKTLPKAFKNKEIVLLPTILPNDPEFIVDKYIETLEFITPLTFYTETTKHQIPTHTSSKTTAINIVKKYATRKHNTKHTPAVDTSQTLMNRWFGNELTSKLLSEAKVILNTFLLDTNLDLYIPEFVIVYEDRVKHQQRGHEYLRNKYKPQFVMSKHFSYQNINYLILFPVNH